MNMHWMKTRYSHRFYKYICNLIHIPHSILFKTTKIPKFIWLQQFSKAWSKQQCHCLPIVNRPSQSGKKLFSFLNFFIIKYRNQKESDHFQMYVWIINMSAIKGLIIKSIKTIIIISSTYIINGSFWKLFSINDVHHFVHIPEAWAWSSPPTKRVCSVVHNLIVNC